MVSLNYRTMTISLLAPSKEVRHKRYHTAELVDLPRKEMTLYV